MGRSERFRVTVLSILKGAEGLKGQILIIIAFFALLAMCGLYGEWRPAFPWIAGGFANELAHLARKSAE